MVNGQTYVAPKPASWHNKPHTMIAIIAFIFGLGVAWTNQTFRVAALESVIKKHESVPDRLFKLEIDLGYVRKDVTDIKDIVKQNSKDMNKYINQRERDRRNGTSD